MRVAFLSNCYKYKGHHLIMKLLDSLQKISRQLLFIYACATTSFIVNAQPTGLLYDPEPPLDSAYVRILIAAQGAAVDVLVDGKMRVKQLPPGVPSDYLVLPAGQHSLTIQAAGKPKPYFSTPLEVVRGRALTVAYTSLQADAKPHIFEDKANSNKLKALIAVYHLDTKAGALDVLSADGKTKVFSAVQFGQSTNIQVNPISIELLATKSTDKKALAHTQLSMTQGGTYSIVLLSGSGGKLRAYTYQNKIERYTGK